MHPGPGPQGGEEQAAADGPGGLGRGTPGDGPRAPFWNRVLKIDLPRALRFVGLGGVSFLTNVGLTVLLTERLHLAPEAALAIAIGFVFVMNFLACRYFVFDAHAQDFRRQLLLFALASGGFRGSEYVAFLVCHRLFGIHYVVALVGILVVSMMAKFVFYQRVVFPGGAGAGGADAGRPHPPSGSASPLL